MPDLYAPFVAGNEPDKDWCDSHIDYFDGTGKLNWIRCASEGENCSLPSGTYIVRYGYFGAYNYKQVTGTVTCNNTTFGDPIESYGKECFYYNLGTFCAGEGGTCTIPSGTHQVGFGSLNSWSFKQVSNSIVCNTTNFSDPYYGINKSCYYN